MTWEEFGRLLILNSFVMFAHWAYIGHLRSRIKALEKHNETLWDRNWRIIEGVERAIQKEWTKWGEKL